ncbi:MAG: bifunctional diaminohydroxyphosphoribosylaminopyrimidine deaminase/5-amino-6-(5-phosphoribosylamino)uracil reductase RibD [Candidatus Omnitrophica bacterium]|nr:bifunctional diaminohydroxyphosphoribosylaminopyrimidine deaminase/5-amino-6-(5-phosphoribosylamino)uracil reductase RibD [Candidatus Omnitrophota bacterium]
MTIDERYMRMALGLARRAEGLTNPNPAVGAVIVKDGKIVGKGYHKRCGLPHAEVNALREAGSKARGATLYVTLEPCDHFGRTGPCTEAIIKAGIKRVVAAMKDPNPIVSGKGLKKLKRHGIKVSAGLCKDAAANINKPFIKFVTTGMPYVTVKMAESLDGKIAANSGDSKWITADDSRRYVHGLRAKADVVMVGVNTVIKDDPLLISKVSKGKQPARVIVDSSLKTPPNARIFSHTDISPVYIAATKYGGKRCDIIKARADRGKVDLKDLLKKLGRMGFIHVMVEGGGELAASLVEKRLADEFLFFIAPKIIGGRSAVTSVEGAGIRYMKSALALRNVKIRKFKKDILIKAEV